MNHHTLAADLLWTEVLIYYGEQLRAGDDYGELKQFVRKIVREDPYFKPIYNWFPPIYVLKNFPPERKQLEYIADLGESALEKYPGDWKIPFTIGALFAYYGMPDKPAAKIWRLEQSLYFFREATSIPESPPYLEQTITQIQGRLDETIRRRRGETVAARRSYHRFVDSAFLGESYFSTPNSDWKSYLRDRLRRKGLEKQVISEPLDMMRRDYRNKRTRHLSYLPSALWSEVVSYGETNFSPMYDRSQ
jgi:hypothetical protein